jgi:hypothetical protein
MQVHIVPAVVMDGGAAPGAFEEVAGLGGVVARRMAEFQSVKPIFRRAQANSAFTAQVATPAPRAAGSTQ